MNSVPHWHPSGAYPIRAVGVSFCRDELSSLVRNPKNKEAFAFGCAKLIPYDSNPHDGNAVRVEVDGIKIGHLSRDMALAIRKRLIDEFKAPIITTCDAVISGGFEASNRSYEYMVDLDFDLEGKLSDSIAPTYTTLTTTDTRTITENHSDGCFYATGWLGRDALENLDEKLDIMSWTTEDWSEVNYYIMHLKRCGLGHKFISIPKDAHLRMFGNWDPGVTVTSLKGRHVTAKMTPSVTEHDKYWPALEKYNVPEPQESNLPNSFTQAQWLSGPYREQTYVWAHVSSNGLPFYVGRGRFSTAWTHHGRKAWEDYIKHYLDGKYHVVILEHGLTEIQAQSIVDNYSKEYAKIFYIYSIHIATQTMKMKSAGRSFASRLGHFMTLFAMRRILNLGLKKCVQALEIQYAIEEINSQTGLYGTVTRKHSPPTVDMFFIKPLVEDLVEAGRTEEARNAIKQYLLKSRHSAEKPTLLRLVKMAERGIYKRRKAKVEVRF